VFEGRAKDLLYERFRWSGFQSTVLGSLPVPFFGDIKRARAATIGINPSWIEYLDRDGGELRGSERRLETLASLGVTSRADLTDTHCNRAIHRMLGYFSANPYSGYFDRLNRVASGMGLGYIEGTLVHLDLVQEATRPAWSRMRRKAPEESDELLRRDLGFLDGQLRVFPLKTVLCNGRTVLEEVKGILGGTLRQAFDLKRITAYAGEGEIDGRPIGVVGWNRPLHTATGLTSDGEVELGRRLRNSLP